MLFKFIYSFASLFLSSSLFQNEDVLHFTNFINTYNKSYENSELTFRFDIFKNNLQKINDHNSQGHTWTMSINKFADLTSEEFKEQNTCYNSESSFFNSKKLRFDEYVNTNVIDVSDLPTEFDWTTKGIVTPVLDQAQCGSCYAFSSVEAIESAYAIANGGKIVNLSEQQIVDCSGSYGNEGCNGGLFVPTFEYVEKNGICSSKEYPYNGVAGKCKKCTSVTKVDSYVEVTPNDENALQKALSIQPISVAIEADETSFQFYSSGVLTAKCGTNLDHGVLLVGWGTLNGQDYWKVRNSWGSSWGENGYVLLLRNVEQTGGQCGIAMQPSYPIILSSN